MSYTVIGEDRVYDSFEHAFRRAEERGRDRCREAGESLDMCCGDTVFMILSADEAERMGQDKVPVAETGSYNFRRGEDGETYIVGYHPEYGRYRAPFTTDTVYGGHTLLVAAMWHKDLFPGQPFLPYLA